MEVPVHGLRAHPIYPSKISFGVTPPEVTTNSNEIFLVSPPSLEKQSYFIFDNCISDGIKNAQ